jgi:polyhydroxybutyrate depolymerase
MRAVLGFSFGVAALACAGACGSTTSTPADELASGSVAASMASSGTGDASTSTASGGAGGTAGSGGAFEGPIGGARPVDVQVPPGYDPAKPAPLLLLLHGYVAGGGLQELYFGLGSEAAARGYLFAHPNGTKDKTGLDFWNATDACCNFYGATVDDSAYLATVIAQIRQAYSVDPKRIFLIGHSNGGFMTHRMACEHADVIATIATLAGSTWDDPSKCTPSEPVSALVMHGTLDPVIFYGGGQLLGNSYPGAVETAASWAKLDGCDAVGQASPTKLDLIGTFLDETTVTRWTGCAPGIDVEHWRIEAGTHVPLFKPEWKTRVFDFFDAHPKP